ncbi:MULTISPECIES: type II toxin-antitoxin system Phd/YefM family antitoxin [Acetobacterales]|uniref:Antitoxin n=1 Tax=Neoroseomonas soli TaxID=1081025 RepID=A0A9X9WTQ4_9PROT|nr:MULTISPECIES: type II toxin-antitoxin system Phd/YefM family antitoxin [Acetobacteraceae]MBR0670533.1 type II toxin-antitoxin system Phd/YefM family antitoxin [Neoroseomonas soli]
MTEPMLKVPAAEAQRNFGLYQDKALTQPVAITRNGRPRTVLLSIEEYERLKRRDREVMRSEDMPQDLAEAILKAEPPEESKRFDHEVR